MNSRERLLTALNHREPDRLPFDLGSTQVTGIHVVAYRRLREYPGLPRIQPQLCNTIQQLALPDGDVIERLGVDVRGLFPLNSHNWNIHSRDIGDYWEYTDEWGITHRRPKPDGLYFSMVRSPLASAALTLDEIRAHRWPLTGDPQRIGIARALALSPKFIVCDEPVSALDVSIQAQVLNLLSDLQKSLSLTYLFISHDLSVVEHISDRVAVMYLGSIVELAPSQELYANPRHPYTEALLSAVPSSDPDRMVKRILLPGDVPNPANPPPGCKFHPRCRYAQSFCQTDIPQWREIAPDHWGACHLADKLSLVGIAPTNET